MIRLRMDMMVMVTLEALSADWMDIKVHGWLDIMVYG